MTMQRRNLLRGTLLLALCFEAVSGFQQCALSVRSSSLTPLSKGNSPVVRFLSSPPPQYDENEFDSTPYGGADNYSSSVDQPDALPAQSIPKLKIPKPSLSVPEIDIKETLKKVALLVLTVLAFIAIQKGGLILSEIFTPELSEEQVKNFVL